MPQLDADCLNEIFEFLEEDKATLYSCLLVNRLWCEVSVRILWKNIWDAKLSLEIINTLIACLPSESKEYLHKNNIVTLDTITPLFNYPSFCKALSINEINILVVNFLGYHYRSFKYTRNINKNKDFVQEILNMFMNQISSLRKLSYCLDICYDWRTPDDIIITGSIDCLTDLSEFICYSNVHSDFFHQLSQICHNIKSLNVTLTNSISNGLKDLILSQNGLKDLSLSQSDSNMDSTEINQIILSLTKHSNTITKLNLEKWFEPLSLSFITKFTNLEKLVLYFDYESELDDDFQYDAKFPQLQILTLYHAYPEEKEFTKFLENNGRNLKEFNIYNYNSATFFNSTVARFCPNLKSLCTHFMHNEVQTLKEIFKSCQQLESIKVEVYFGYLKLNTILSVVAIHSPENFHELKLCASSAELLPGDLNSFFKSWKDRIPLKPLSFVIECTHLVAENVKIIETYEKLDSRMFEGLLEILVAERFEGVGGFGDVVFGFKCINPSIDDK